MSRSSHALKPGSLKPVTLKPESTTVQVVLDMLAAMRMATLELDLRRGKQHLQVQEQLVIR